MESQVRPQHIPLMQHEEKIYFSSDWYKEQIRARRRKLIADGWITWADDHPNNPAPKARIAVIIH